MYVGPNAPMRSLVAHRAFSSASVRVRSRTTFGAGADTSAQGDVSRMPRSTHHAHIFRRAARTRLLRVPTRDDAPVAALGARLDQLVEVLSQIPATAGRPLSAGGTSTASFKTDC
ncbi:hypothetical protein HNR56_003977 [Roseospira marina]|nr:hypothetical protein [Roseospira marina]MBB5089260.1 hypothetical protein [Roseospira marina]